MVSASLHFAGLGESGERDLLACEGQGVGERTICALSVEFHVRLLESILYLYVFDPTTTNTIIWSGCNGVRA